MAHKKTTKKRPAKKQHFIKKYFTRKNIIIGSVALILLITGYVLLCAPVRISVRLIDQKSGTAVAEATVLYGGKEYISDDSGLLTLHAKGKINRYAQVYKPFYEPKKLKLPTKLLGRTPQQTITLQAKGEVIKVTVKNRISGRLMSGVVVKAHNGGQGRTNENGVAMLILPTGVMQAEATVEGDSILPTTATLFNANDATTNIVQVIPKGKIYYLQKTGAFIDVKQSNLDGTESKTVVAATGFENSDDTQLLMSTEGDFVALKAQREASVAPALYLYDTTKQNLVTIDAEQQNFIPIGWIGTRFVYMVHRPNVAFWQNAKQTIKSYDAATMQTTIIEETRGEGNNSNDYVGEIIENVYLLVDKIVVAKKWQSSYYYGGRYIDKYMVINSSQADGSEKTTLQQWQAGYNATIKTVQSDVSSLHIFVELDGVKRSYYTLAHQKITETLTVDNDFTNRDAYPMFHVSANRLIAAWSQKNNSTYTIYMSAKDGEGAEPIATFVPYTVVGWYANDYILLSDDSQQLYVMSRRGIKQGLSASKIDHFYKPSKDYRTFGYGR